MELFDFIEDATVKNILDFYQIKTEEDIVNVLETYKFCSSYTIVSKLNKCKEFESIQQNTGEELIPYAAYIESFSQSAKYTNLMDRFDILIGENEDGSVEVIAPLYKELDFTALLLNLEPTISSFRWVTPINFEKLKDPSFKVTYLPDLLFRRIILECVNLGATDVHFTVRHVNKEPEYIILYRQDGSIRELNLFKLNAELNAEIITKAISMLTKKSAEDLNTPDGVVASITDAICDKKIELRLSANKVREGYECVCRIQNVKTVSMTIADLGFPDYVQNAMYKMCRKTTGLTLFTGPIRTGKNTSAFALANEFVKKPLKIKSFESPIEALMPFPQVDYLDEPGYLEDAIRLAKKQDVNIAFLNEIPNKNVAFGVQDLVNSSIHVITTLHIDRIWHLPYKLFEYYGESYRNIISQINCVFNQKMFPLLCQECTENMLTEDLEDDEVKELLLRYNVTSVGVAAGCHKCFDLNTGTFGVQKGKNQPFVEFLIFTDDLKSRLLSTQHVHEMEKILKDAIMKEKRSLEYEICKAIKNKQISVDSLYSVM